ncbi:MAG: hypothetical protein QOH47_1539 [Sphingomonadales bacterium]|nr:hypothetical protein [Sphingomonadales bacterium]
MGTNHDIYDKRLTAAYPWKLFDYVPYCIYFYYVVLDEDHKPRVDHYFYVDGPPSDPSRWQPIPVDGVAAIIPGLVTNARLRGTNPPPSGANFQDIVWTRKSHIVILVDEADWSLHKLVEGRTALSFNVAKGSTPNHSFFDARDIEIQFPRDGGTDTRSAIALVNHMKRNSDGDDLLGGEAQRFVFDVYLDVGYSGSPASPLTVIFDPDGNNLGPPLPPP